MFTGLIEQVGELISARHTTSGREIAIRSELSSELCIGQSIAINGACLSVTNLTSDTFTVMAVPETLSKTTLGKLQNGALVNLERALTMGARLDGHIVQGHIDTTCRITSLSQERGERMYEFQIPEEYTGLIIYCGSIALDGISLTIADLHNSSISVAIIPHTYEHTNVRNWEIGTYSNVEFDVLGKYVERQLSSSRGGIDSA